MTERAPTIHVDHGILVIDWPEPRPASFEITAEAFIELVEWANMNAGANPPLPA